MTMPPLSDMPTPRKFHYLLNAMEHASQCTYPADNDYAGKRKAVLQYVAQLERDLTAMRAAVIEEYARLDFVLEQGAFIDRSKTDTGAIVYQLMNQDEDEDFHTISGDDKFYATTRAAIDAAIRALPAPPAMKPVSSQPK